MENQVKLDEMQCFQFGTTASNISTAVMQGATEQDILALLDNDRFKGNPQDIQRLVIVLVKFLTSVGKGNSPADDFNGAFEFCKAGGGDVEKLISVLEATMGTSI